MKSAAILVLLHLFAVLAAAKEPAPTVQSTDPRTGVTTEIPMRSEKELPPAEVALARRTADSVYGVLSGALRGAATRKPLKVQVGPLVQGGALVGAAMQADGTIAFATTDVPGVAPRDYGPRLAWAMWFAKSYHPQQALQFTLDPKNVNDFTQGNNAIYLPDSALAPFGAGKAMFLADMQLKYYSLGKRLGSGGKEEPVGKTPPGYRTMLQIRADLQGQGIATDSVSRNRLWIVCDTLYAVASDSAIRIDSVRIRVLTRRIGAAAGNRMVDIGGEDTAALRFCHWFETHYWELAREHAELRDVAEYAKAVAIARWILAHQETPDLRWADALLATESSVVRSAPAMQARDTVVIGGKPKRMQVQHIVGGVEMSPHLTLRAQAQPYGKSTQGSVRLQRMDSPQFRTTRQEKDRDYTWDVGVSGVVSATPAGGPKIQLFYPGTRSAAARQMGEASHAQLQPGPDGGMLLQYSDQQQILEARFDAQGRRTALWQYPRKVAVAGTKKNGV